MPAFALLKPCTQKMIVTTQSASGKIQLMRTQKPKVTAVRIALMIMIAMCAMVTVIWKFSDSLPSELVCAPRSLNTSQMISGGRIQRMPPRCANDAHWLSSAWDSGAAAAGDGACSVIDLPFGCGLLLDV